jgi:hypothetical protein
LILAAGLVVAQPRAAHAAVVPGTTCSVFPPDNIWNTDISTLPVNANSATWVASTMPSSSKLHLQPSTTYAVRIVWKASRPPAGSSTIYAGAGPINAMFSPTSLTAVVLSSP